MKFYLLVCGDGIADMQKLSDGIKGAIAGVKGQFTSEDVIVLPASGKLFNPSVVQLCAELGIQCTFVDEAPIGTTDAYSALTLARMDYLLARQDEGHDVLCLLFQTPNVRSMATGKVIHAAERKGVKYYVFKEDDANAAQAPPKPFVPSEAIPTPAGKHKPKQNEISHSSLQSYANTFVGRLALRMLGIRVKKTVKVEWELVGKT